MESQIRALWRAITLFRHYQPQKITIHAVWLWLKQFPRDLRWAIFALLNNIIFISTKETEKFLVKGNAEILSRLKEDNIGPENIIYVTLDTPGSSSGVMLNILRDTGNMERRKAKFINVRDGDLMTKLSNELGSGAVVYVDDFAGTGKQFRRNRDAIAPFITGNFAEFFVTVCVCEEAVRLIEEVGVVSLHGFVHYKCERPLHPDSVILPNDKKVKLVSLSRGIHPEGGLGFKKMATMVILARNAPNTTPLLFRGSLKQEPIRGIFPRWDDLPY